MVLDIKDFIPMLRFMGLIPTKTFDQAIELGVIDEVATFADLMHADFVIVSVPVDASRLFSSFEAIGDKRLF
jgi:prephenate dehydrogenase